jgi:hypothetical protein
MTQFPHDQFVKEYLPELMGEYGLVNAGESVSSELREIDVFFCPNKPVPTTPETLGLLGKMAQTTCLFEVFRKPVEIHQIQECMGKLFDIQGLQRREKRKNKQILSKDEIPFLWILTPTLGQRISYEIITCLFRKTIRKQTTWYSRRFTTWYSRRFTTWDSRRFTTGTQKHD